MPDGADVAATLAQLCNGGEFAEEDLAPLLGLLLVALRKARARRGGSASQRRRQLLAAIATELAASSRAGADRPLQLAGLAHVVLHVVREIAENPPRPGRGYSILPRARNRVRTRHHRVGELRQDPTEFKNNFSLFPDEYDWLWQNGGGAAVHSLPKRNMHPQDRLALCLRYWRDPGHGQGKHAEFLGGNPTGGNEDIRALTGLLFEGQFAGPLEAEIAWPDQATLDKECTMVAEWRINLGGMIGVADHAKRKCDVRGRSLCEPHHL